MCQNSFLRRMFILVLIVTILSVAAVFIFTQQITAWDFRNNLWGPTHLLVTGRSPYLIEQLFSGSNSVWMPTIIGALFPLGWLPESIATNLWLIASILITLALYVLAIQPFTDRPPIGYTGVALIGAFLFPPFISHLILGQFSLFAALFMLLAVYLISRKQLFPAAFMIVLGATKPQLVVLPILGLFFAVYQEKGWRGLAILITACVGFALLLTLPLWIAHPNWIEGMFIALGRNPIWAHPSIFTLLRGSIVLWGILAVGAVTLNFVLWKRLPLNEAVTWSLALNLLITPYVWSWDFVLILPLLFQTLFRLRSWLAKSVLSIGYTGIWLGILNIRLNTEGDDVRFWWVCWALIAVVLIAHLADRRVKVLPDVPLPT
jgi:hypothetical protein